MSLYNNKIILIGGSGFLGQNFSKLLEERNIEYHSTSSSSLDLINLKNRDEIENINKSSNQTIVFFSALTPDKGKNIDTFNLNIKMAQNFLENLDDHFEKNNQIMYVSSDAVYPLNEERINFNTKPEPTDLYSAMHSTREIMFKNKFSENLTIIRPTLIYGFGDTHNSYGPNRYFNQYLEKNEINIFGEGLDVRDHLYIRDLCEIIYKIIKKKIFGTFNIASGNSISYKELGNLFQTILPNVKLNFIPVNNIKTLRYFDVNDFFDKIDFKPSKLVDNLKEYKDLLNLK